MTFIVFSKQTLRLVENNCS